MFAHFRQVLWRAGDISTEPREHLVGTSALDEYQAQLVASGCPLPAGETSAVQQTRRPRRAAAMSDDESDGESNSALHLVRPLAMMLQSANVADRHLSADVITALIDGYTRNEGMVLSRVYALLFALAEARVSLVDDLTFPQRNSVMLELLEGGPRAAGRELRAMAIPGCVAAASIRIPDEEALLAAGSVPIYEVAVDARGQLVRGSHHISTHDRTMVHDTLGPSNLLRVELPEDDALSGSPQGRSAFGELRDTLAEGLVVCGKRFDFFGAKSDHKMRAIKVHFVAVASAWPLHTREPSSRPWRTANEARSLLAAFEELPTVEKQLKRLELMFSSTVRVLDDVAFSVERRRGALTPADFASLQASTPGHAKIYVCDDVAGTLPDGRPALNADGEPRLMSDGAGFISLDLAKRIPAVLSGKLVRDADHGNASAPLVTQLRLWLEGLLAKGTLLTCSTLPDGVIVLRKGSMVKVDGGAGGAIESSATAGPEEPPPPHLSPSATLRVGFSRVEICETSERAPSARLGASLIEILAAGSRRAGGQSAWDALARHLTDLQEAEVRRVRKLLIDSDQSLQQADGHQSQSGQSPSPWQTDCRRVRAAALAELAAGSDSSNSLGVSASSMLLSGFDAMHEPRLVELLQRLEEARLTSLGTFKLPLAEATSVFGQPDPTGSLPEGHVCVVVQGMELAHQLCRDGDDERGAVREVLVHKSPGCHAGDVRKLKHARTPELEALLRGVDRRRAHAIFFSTRGERAVADMIAGCDHDGDKFTVISDPTLVRLFDATDPWKAPPRGKKSATTPDPEPQTLQVLPFSHHSCSWKRDKPSHLGPIHSRAPPATLATTHLQCLVRCDAAPADFANPPRPLQVLPARGQLGPVLDGVDRQRRPG